MSTASLPGMSIASALSFLKRWAHSTAQCMLHAIRSCLVLIQMSCQIVAAAAVWQFLNGIVLRLLKVIFRHRPETF